MAARTASWRDAALATAAYAVLAIAMTWPLARGITRDVPGDFGDPLLNVWALTWDAEHLLRAVTGHLGALGEYWNANIFYPHPLALAYSEHLTAEAIQILPVYALTRSPLLCYNLLFLSTFVLSGLGAYLLGRELTGSRAAGFVAGVAYAFAPYRFGTLAHVQVLSSAWMPFTLYALHRYFESGQDQRRHDEGRKDLDPTRPARSGFIGDRRAMALAGAVAAFAAQALSCGYYLMYFAPVVVLFAAWEINRGGRWRDARMWAELAAAAAVTGAVVVPFLLPYLELRRTGSVLPRSITETDGFAADVYAYLTADVQLWFWGHVARAWPRGEGSLFPGVTIAVLATATLVLSWRDVRGASPRSVTARLLGWAVAGTALVGLALLLHGSIRVTLGPIPFKANDIDRIAGAAVLLSILLLAVSPPSRSRVVAWLRTPAAAFAIVALFSIVMSFGPHIHSRGRLVDEASLYTWFFNHVPGYDGLRVPARFAMIATLALAVLASGAIARAPATSRRLVAAGAVLAIAVESWSTPILINYADPTFAHSGLVANSDTVAVTPQIYEHVRSIPRDAVLLELPIGEPAFDARAMFFSTSHWRRLVNGYSGSAPVDYALRAEDLNDVFRAPERAWTAVDRSGATHLLVHEAAYIGDGGRRVSAWATSHGAREVARAGTDRLFALPRR